MKEERHCATCANWIPQESASAEGKESLLSSRGECHRYAPRPLILERQAAGDAQLVWPETRAVDVCGEWYYGGPRLRPQETPSVLEKEEPPTLLAANELESGTPPRRSTT
ncbi:MAG: hypothetical protein WAN46_18050 [Gammaproteobacteria bacterium]|jgi:hypothetical protein